MLFQQHGRRLVTFALAMVLVSSSASAETSFSRRKLLTCAAGLALAVTTVGGWYFAPAVMDSPIRLVSDGKDSKVADPAAAAQELRDLLTARGGTLRVNVSDIDGNRPTLRLFDKTRLQKFAAEKIKAAIQKRNPNVDGSEIGVGQEGMAVRVHYLELSLKPDGRIGLAVGGMTWRLESPNSYAAEDVLSGSARQMDFGPHIEVSPGATATFRAGFLIRFDATTRSFAVPHAKCTMRVDARPWVNDEDSAELRDITTGEVR